ncbi:MAG: hypothetical protein WAN50_04530 [Minisyncoccia bacterium]
MNVFRARWTLLAGFFIFFVALIGIWSVVYARHGSAAAGKTHTAIQWSDQLGAGEAFPACGSSGVGLDSSCVSISAPETVTAGTQFSASITMLNAGEYGWGPISTDSGFFLWPDRVGVGDVSPMINDNNDIWGNGRAVLPAGSTVNSGANGIFSGTFTAPTTPGTYPFDVRMVADGYQWFGSTCTENITVTAPAACTLPWGGTLANGSSVTAYQASSVNSGDTCNSQTRTCTNGTLSGSYTNQSCTVVYPSCTLPWGGTLANGSSVTAYQSPTAISPITCSSISETRTCTNGTLSGSYTNQNCSQVNPPTVTTFNPTPSSINPGGSSTLTWTSTGATSCTGIGFTAGATSGSAVVSPSTTSSYQLQCTGPGGTTPVSTATVTVLVPSASISATPDRVDAGKTTTISWNNVGVTDCSAKKNGVNMFKGAFATTTAGASQSIASSTTDTITDQTTYEILCRDFPNTSKYVSATQIVNVSTTGFSEF